MDTTTPSAPTSVPQSRNSEFAAGTAKTMQSGTRAGFTNSSVLSPIPGNNGSSDDTFQKNLLHSIYNAR